MSKILSSRGNLPLAKLLVAGAAAISLSLAGVQSARAATLTWDPSITGGTSPGGSGTWNTSLTNWWDGTFDAAWGNTTSDVGVFGGGVGAVSVATALSAGTLQFLTTGYTFTGSAITLGAGGIDASALSSGTTSIANAIALAAGQSWNIGTGASLVASGVISGTNSLAKTGGGTLTLSAINTFSGGLTISQGAVSIAGNTTLGGAGGTAGAVTINGGTLKTTNTAALTNTHAITIGASGGALSITGTGATQAGRVIFTANNLLQGNGALTVSGNGALDAAGGSGALAINGTNSYSGTVTLQNGGMIELGNSNALGSGATYVIGNNGGLDVNTGITLSNAILVNGTNGILNFGNGNAGLITGAITLNNDLTIAMRDWYGATIRSGSISSTITGAHTITMNSGTGNLGTGGTLTLSGFDAKASAADIVLNGASLAVNSGTGTAAASVTRANSLTINTGNVTVAGVATQNTNDVFGTLNLGGGSAGNLQGYSTFIMSPNAATNATLTFTNMGTRTAGSWVAINGTVGGSGTNSANIMFTNGLSGSNLIGAGGSLASGTASVIPWLHDTSGGTIYGYDATVGVAAVTTVNVNPNSTTSGQNINWNAASTLTADRTVNSLQMAFSAIDLGGHTLTVASGVITADNASFSNGTLNFGSAEAQLEVHNARTLTINSGITGSGGLTYVGFRSNTDPGLVLAGANTYTGVTNFYGYGGNTNIRLTNSLALQNSTFNHISGRGYTLTFGNSGTTGQTAYTFGGLSGNANLTLANNNTVVQAVALTVGGDGDSTTYSGVMSDGSAAGGSLIKTGTGTLTLSGANTFTGGVSINGGKLNVAATETAGTSGPLGKTGTISFGGGALQYSAANTFDYSSRFSTAAGQAFSVDTNGQNVTWGTVLTSSGGSLVKAGSGTLTVSAAAAYTGSTTISAGTLLLLGAGSVSSSSVINVASGARFDVSGVTGGNYTIASGQTLNGKGTVVGNTTIAGNLAPGNSPGLLAFSNALTLSGTATMEINNTGTVRGTDYDGANVGGLLTYGGVLNLTMTSLITAGTYNLFDFGSVTGNFSSVAFAGGAYAGTFAYDSGSGTWSATDTNGSGQSFSYSLASGDLTVVPEPATYALFGMGMLLVLTFRRRFVRCRE